MAGRIAPREQKARAIADGQMGTETNSSPLGTRTRAISDNERDDVEGERLDHIPHSTLSNRPSRTARP